MKVRFFFWSVILVSAIVLIMPFDIEIKPLMLLLLPACIFLDYETWKEEKYGGAENGTIIE